MRAYKFHFQCCYAFSSTKTKMISIFRWDTSHGMHFTFVIANFYRKDKLYRIFEWVVLGAHCAYMHESKSAFFGQNNVKLGFLQFVVFYRFFFHFSHWCHSTLTFHILRKIPLSRFSNPGNDGLSCAHKVYVSTYIVRSPSSNANDIFFSACHSPPECFRFSSISAQTSVMLQARIDVCVHTHTLWSMCRYTLCSCFFFVFSAINVIMFMKYLFRDILTRLLPSNSN